MSGLSAADGQVSGALGRLFALAESYPDFKANQNMLALQEELTSTENKVAFARQSFNDAVMKLQHPARVFPASVIASPDSRRPSSSRSSLPRSARRPRCRSDPDPTRVGEPVMRLRRAQTPSREASLIRG